MTYDPEVTWAHDRKVARAKGGGSSMSRRVRFHPNGIILTDNFFKGLFSKKSYFEVTGGTPQCRYPQRPEVSDPPGIGVTGGCEFTDVGVELGSFAKAV
ncbi:hypothetical protein STEG23_032805 [Scotinomys teguina]